jgi:hypothetical protein
VTVSALTGWLTEQPENDALTGFTIPRLIWMCNHETNERMRHTDSPHALRVERSAHATDSG